MSKRGNRRKLARQENSKTSETAADHNQSDEKHPPTPPQTSTPINSNAGEPITDSEKNNSSEQSPDALVAEYTRSLRNWTKGLVFVGLLTVAVLFLQYCTFEKTDHTLKDTMAASNASQRAFVSVASFETPIRRNKTGEVVYWFIPNFKNSGNTPTRNMKYAIRASCPPITGFGPGNTGVEMAMAAHMQLFCRYPMPLAPYVLSPDWKPPPPSDPEEISKGAGISVFLGPQAAIALGGLGITEPSIRAIIDGFPLYMWGVIYYDDIFPESKRHITKFCYQIAASKSVNNDIIPNFSFCDHWNCADDECKDDRKAYDAEMAGAAIQPKKSIWPNPILPTPMPSK